MSKLFAGDETALASLGRSSLFGFFAVSVPIAVLFSPYVASPILDHVGQSVRWFGIAAVTITALAAALCAVGWKVRPTRLLAFTFAVIAIYMLSVVAQYVPSRREWKLVQIATWPAIPLVYVLWARSALNLAYHLHADASFGGKDAPVQKLRQFAGWPRPLPWRSVPTLEVAVSWSIGFLFIVAGLADHGWFYGRSTTPAPEAWRDWTYHPHWGFKLLAVWGFSLASLSSLTLIGSWRVRRHGLPAGIVERARWATYGAAVFVVLDALILWGAESGKGVEPLIDLLIALGVLTLALLTLDVDQFSSAKAQYSSLTKRSLLVGLWLVIVLLAAAGWGGAAVGKAVFASALAILYPLGAVGLRGLSSRPSRIAETTVDTSSSSATNTPPGVDPMERTSPLGLPLRAVDSVADQTDLLRLALSGAASKIEVRGIDPSIAQTAFEQLASITDHEFLQLIGEVRGQHGTHEWTFHRPESNDRRNELEKFIDSFPALEGFAHKPRAQSFARLVYETAKLHPGRTDDVDDPGPSDWRWLRAHCAERTQEATDKGERRAVRAEVLTIRLYMRGDQDVVFRPELNRLGPPYTLAELDRFSVEELVSYLQDASQQVNPAKRRARERALKDVAPIVRQLWLETLEHARRSRGTTGPAPEQEPGET